VSNAVKFTNEGKITVGVRLLHSDEEIVTIEFTITDTGIGISEDKIDHIFENFQQATSNTSRLYGGTGLGLAIAKQLAEQQAGTITVNSKIDKGTTFRVVLPFRRTIADVESGLEIMELKVKVKGIKVLVVEDIALNQLLMKTLLDDFGFDCDFAENGKIAIEKFKNKPYDIILMDLQMPEMNGFQATKYIRDTMNSPVPIIALTADVTTTDLNKCRVIGMNDYISKPIDEKQLYRKIIELVKKPDFTNESHLIESIPKCTDLTYLMERTKSNPKLMSDMILLYLEQTPPLISTMKESLQTRDWDSLYVAVHKIIPSFYIVGIHKKYEDIGKKVQEYASTKQHPEEVEKLVLQLESICNQAYIELKEAYNLIKKRAGHE
jgi:CheY-like chemotaxis protein